MLDSKKQQPNLWEIFKRIHTKRGGQITPVLPFSVHFSDGGAQDSNGGAQDNLPVVRKLAAAVWEAHRYELPFANMQNAGGGGGDSRRNHRLLRLDHHNNRHHHRRHHSPEPAIASSSRRHVAISLAQHHRAIQRTHNDVRPVSPASYGSSSMEVASYHNAVKSTTSIEFKGNLKPSTELLKVLNRIWTLEQQYAANTTLVKALKRELDLARSKIKELARDRRDMERLVKQLTDDQQDHANATLQSVKDELEDERKLRKRSETLHRKLARELRETKTLAANALKDLENERKSRMLLEDLCDEFALHSLKDSNFRSTRDGMILHVSESWLDQRMQMKQETAFAKKHVAEQLRSEIEGFLEAKRKGVRKVESGSGSVVGPTAQRRHSLESVLTNLAASIPPKDDDDDDDDDGDSPCFELDKRG